MHILRPHDKEYEKTREEVTKIPDYHNRTPETKQILERGTDSRVDSQTLARSLNEYSLLKSDIQVDETMTINHSGMTPEAIEELINRRVEEALAAHEATCAANALENGNGNPNENGRGNRPVARECTYQDFMKCQPLNFKGTKGVNSHKRTIGTEASFVMSWRELMKQMTEVYCPRNEIQKMETELWNLTIKNNDLTAYTQRFQELTMMCTKMVPREEDRVEKFIGGLPDNIQGNVIAVEPTRLQDSVRIANNLMDQNLKGYAMKNVENKRRLEVNQRDKCG
ncbi:reverse transcriptase domain-containing protein [Tanacetum coccineum]|uniref:Reverse transcriptase domain-containing protein n=1 Tax=Tanacetum coccineum TaxID=301880 RepID=A0ABQ4Z3S0_9ASTR